MLLRVSYLTRFKALSCCKSIFSILMVVSTDALISLICGILWPILLASLSVIHLRIRDSICTYDREYY
jgi:hypothetical protein